MMDKVIEVLNEKLEEVYEELTNARDDADYYVRIYEETLKKLQKVCPHKRMRLATFHSTALPGDGTTGVEQKYECVDCSAKFTISEAKKKGLI